MPPGSRCSRTVPFALSSPIFETKSSVNQRVLLGPTVSVYGNDPFVGTLTAEITPLAGSSATSWLSTVSLAQTLPFQRASPQTNVLSPQIAPELLASG